MDVRSVANTEVNISCGKETFPALATRHDAVQRSAVNKVTHALQR